MDSKAATEDVIVEITSSLGVDGPHGMGAGSTSISEDRMAKPTNQFVQCPRQSKFRNGTVLRVLVYWLPISRY